MEGSDNVNIDDELLDDDYFSEDGSQFTRTNTKSFMEKPEHVAEQV
jgi:hypothetical protein